MRTSLPRALCTAALLLTAACASSTGAGVSLGGDTGGRYLVMIPPFAGPDGEQVANQLRELVTAMPTHAAINHRDVREQMAEYDVSTLDEVTARQLAQLIDAQLVSWGTTRSAADGLEADVKFVDTRSGDEIVFEGITGATPIELATNIFAQFERSVEGMRQAIFCNDYLASQSYERALESCEAALAIVPSSTSAMYAKATSLLYLEREEEALDTYRQLLAGDPSHADALLGAGLAASRLERGEEAMGSYNRFLQINPGNVQVRMAVTNDIAETGDYLSAYRVLETAIAENADNADFQRYLFSIATAAGQLAIEQTDTATAHEIFEVALAAYDAGFGNDDAPDPAQLRQVIAVNNALGRTEEAIRIARDATARFPEDAQIWSQLATVHAQAGQHADAIQALNRVIELDPGYENVYIRRAQSYIQTGQRQQAMVDLERAAQRGDRQTVAQVLYNLGAEGIRAERWDDAAAALSAAHEYASGSLRNDVSFYWGFSVYKQGETIARANTQGNVQQARRALEFFQQAVPLLEASSHAQAGAVLSGARQYIENQQAIVRAGQG